MKHKLPPWLSWIERFVDRSIPFMLVLLAVMIVVELLHLAGPYEPVMEKLDYLVIAFFVVDLCFKWYHVRNVLKFVKLYWIDIIAVFPFYAIFRVYFAAAELLAAGEPVQKLLHEGVLLRETKLLRGAEYAKFVKEVRWIRVFARSLRILRARWYVAHWHMQAVSKRNR
ncbi:ion transporter [Candidatus Woesearchaeota archaeon]|nr:ion transporter [Candidatus Woesearchaeota archaeon]